MMEEIKAQFPSDMLSKMASSFFVSSLFGTIFHLNLFKGYCHGILAMRASLIHSLTQPLFCKWAEMRGTPSTLPLHIHFFRISCSMTGAFFYSFDFERSDWPILATLCLANAVLALNENRLFYPVKEAVSIFA